MDKETISFRLDAARRKALDAIAAGLDRDRSYVINSAINNYLEVNAWQIKHIKEGLHQAQKGDFAGDAEVSRALARWRR